MNLKIKGKGKPVLLIHGWGTSGKIWEGCEELIKKDYKLFIIDLPGMGSSPIINPYNIKKLIEQIDKIIPEKVTIIGWSLGGLIAIQYALKYPKKINSLICISSTPCFVQKKGWSYGVDMNFFKKFNRDFISNWRKTLKKFFILQLIKSKTNKMIINKLENDFIGKSPPSKEALKKTLSILEETDIRNDIKKINLPTLVIAGRKDMITDYRSTIWLKKNIKNSESYIFDNAGHMPFVSHKKEFVGLIKKFIEKYKND